MFAHQQHLAHLRRARITLTSRAHRSGNRTLFQHAAAVAALFVVAVSNFAAVAAADSIQPTQTPVAAVVRVQSIQHALDADSPMRARILSSAVNRLVQRAEINPNSLIVLKLQDFPLRYDELSLADRRDVDRLAALAEATHPSEWFQEKVAAFISSAMSAARNKAAGTKFSVEGLPLESRDPGVRAIQSANGFYMPIVEQLDAIVISDPLAVSSGSSTQSIIDLLRVRRASAVTLAGGRPIYFRMNGQWQTATISVAKSPAPGSDGRTAPGINLGDQDNGSGTVGGIDPASLDISTFNDLVESLGIESSQQSIVALMYEEWGQSGSGWDINDDGTVDIFDVLMALNNYETYSQLGYFNDISDPYVLGSGENIRVGTNDWAPSNIRVVFKLHSFEADATSLQHIDTEAPFIYPASILDQAAPGLSKVVATIETPEGQLLQELEREFSIVEEQQNDEQDPPDGGGDDGPTGQFVNVGDVYLVGSMIDVLFEMLPAAPQNPNVVFQVWSNVSGQIEAVYPDYNAPFVYPGESLASVTPGAGQIQALVRNESNEIVEIVKAHVTFVQLIEDDGGNDGGGGDDGETPPDDDGGDDAPIDDEDDDDTPPADDGEDDTPPNDDGGEDDAPQDDEDDEPVPTGPAPVPSITTRGVTGTAPYTVFVHALDSDLLAGDILTAYYQWDFGDPDGAHNVLTGWTAAHTYDEPGTYQLTLTLRNETGGQAVTSVPVIVAADDRDTIYVAANGNDSNPGTVSQPIKSVVKAKDMLDDDTRVLFRRGDTFNTADELWINDDNILIGAYGSGDRPRIRWNGSTSSKKMIRVSSTASKVVIQDLDILSISAGSVRGINLEGEEITVRRCNFTELSYATNSELGINGLFLCDNTAGIMGRYFYIGAANDLAIVGNTVAGSQLEHNIRLRGTTRVLVARNNLTNNIEPGETTSKNTIWAMKGTHGCFINNTLFAGPIKVGRNVDDNYFHWSVFDGNHITGNEITIKTGAEHIMFRNNISVDHDQTFAIDARSNSLNRSTTDIRLVNNTAVFTGSKCRFIDLNAEDGPVEGLLVSNNMFIAPNMDTNQSRTGNFFSYQSPDSNYLFANNLWADASGHVHYADETINESEWDSLSIVDDDHYRHFVISDIDADYCPQFDARIGQAAKGVHTDCYGSIRPLSGTVTVGAVELPEEE